MASLNESLTKYGLDGDNLSVLKAAGEILIPELDAVLEAFYARARANPEAASFFSGESQMASARGAQKAHWSRLLSADFGSEYQASTERIGRTHARIKLPFEVYMSSYAVSASDILEALMRKGSGIGKAANLRKMVGVVSRAFAFDVEQATSIIFKVMSEEEQGLAFKYLNGAIDELANGNLAHFIPGPEESDYPAAYNDVRVKFNGAIENLSSVIETVATAVDTLLGNVEQVSNGAVELSNRTTNQAASLEETAAAMEEITQSVKDSSSNTDEANSVAQKARDEVMESVTVVQETSEAMSEIKASSDKINQITALIEDIAFQTNLLALNAGVEAARAGDAGRGFAVVASEVRGLAANASGAVKDIKDLIFASSQQVDNGVKLVEAARGRLEGVSVSFNQVSDLSSQVAHASSEQTRSLAEINDAVAQMDLITQQNAEMVGQTTQSVERIQSNAYEINQILGTLQLSRHQANVHSAAA